MNGKNLLALFAVVLMCFKVTEAACSTADVSTCAAPVTQYSSVATLTQDDFNRACSNLGNVSSCLTSAGCSENDPSVISNWAGMKDSFTYACGDGRQTFLKNGSCFGTPTVLQKIKSCNDAYLAAVQGGGTVFCGATQAWLNCLAKAVQDCGSEEMNVFNTFSFKTIDAPSKLRQCSLKQGDASVTSPANAGVVHEYSLLLVVLTAFMLAFFLH